MNRVITLVVLATFIPMQLYALDFSGLGSDTQIEYSVPRGPDQIRVQPDKKLSDKILEKPPKAVEVESSGTNWWMWGGLAVVAGGVVALAASGGKSGGSSSGGGGGGGSTTTTVTGSW